MAITTREKITVARIEALARRAKAEKQALYLWDAGPGSQPGYGVRASAGDKRAQKISYLADRWRDGDHQQVSFGQYPTLSPDEAREEARTRIASKEPLIAAKKTERQEALAKREAIGIGAAVERYLAEAPLEKKRKPRPSYWKQAGQTLSRELVKGLGADTKLRTVTLDDLRKLIKAKQLAEQPAAARYLYATLSAFLNWCAGEGLIDSSPLDSYANKPKPGDGRDRILTDAELKNFWKATDADDFWHPYFRLCLLTAQRREEVAAMDRREIDLETATWTIPGNRTKNGVPHVVHLSSQAIAEIERCKSEGHYLFPATPMVDRHGNPIPLKKPTISGFAKPKRRLDRMMGIESHETKKGYDPSKLWRVHDLRRTARSGFARLRVPREVAEKILNHITGATKLDKIYDRFEYLDERKEALIAWGNLVERIVSEKAAANNVIPIHNLGVA